MRSNIGKLNLVACARNVRGRGGFIRVFVAGVMISCSVRATELASRAVPTHASAAIIFAKHSGLFDRYVAKDASLSECISFLNEQGVYIGLMEVVNGSEFGKDDCARVMGQIELLLAGEATFLRGKVLLPKGFDSWKRFCILEGVEYERGYEEISKALCLARELNY